MKKTVAVAFVLLAVLAVSSGLAMACELCDGLRALGYNNAQIVSLISSSATRPEAEERMRQVIVQGRQQPTPRAQYYQSATGPEPKIAVANSRSIQYSNEVIEVPPDIERR